MKIFYFTDPMCSWCYGFSPAIQKMKVDYPEVDLQIIPGGFAPFSKQVVYEEYRAFLEYHWRNVHQRSGQTFNHTMPFVSDTFRYDTEPSSRALVVVQHLSPDKDFAYLSLLQRSFYVEGKDITNGTVLAALAGEIGIDPTVFLAQFYTEEMKQKTVQGFEFSRQLGVQGFPTLLTFEQGATKVLTHGFHTYPTLQKAVEAQLAKQTALVSAHGQTCAGDSCDL